MLKIIDKYIFIFIAFFYFESHVYNKLVKQKLSILRYIYIFFLSKNIYKY